jgi:hypothetical protein
MPADLVDPAASAPVLDLSETAIHLGEVGRDERLPPERIAVINRGGGTLDWTAESSASWVEPEAQGSAVVLHLHPRPGPNRANIYVREAGGALKTIRVSVRVRELASSAASETKGRSSETTEPNEPMPRTGGRDEPPSIPLANEVAMPPPTPPPPQPPPPPVTLQPPPLRQRVSELFRPKSDHSWSWLFVAGVGLLGFFCGLPPLILGLMNLRQPNRRKQSLVLIAIAGLWWIVILASSA